MVLSRLARLFEKKPVVPPALPLGMRIYAIGDVHGRLDLLDALAKQVQADLASAPSQTLTIFLGDYVDRGKDSAGVLDRLARSDFPTPIHTLRGNHEEMIFKFLADETELEDWRRYGGLETLHSYGLNVSDAMRGTGYSRLQGELAASMPAQHRTFLAKTQLSLSFGDYFFCHAGVRPGVALDDQISDDLLWIRDEFLRFEGSHGKIVVHGHTPVSAPDVKSNRINIDTGAFATSVLTALVLEGTERRFLATR